MSRPAISVVLGLAMALAACAGQPPGGGLSDMLRHAEQERGR